jgi:hypothetical protein
MDRPIIYDQEQGRLYDFLSLAREFVYGSGIAWGDLFGSTASVVSGFAATASSPASLVINIAAGRIYLQAAVDATAYSVMGTDARQTVQQGIAAAQSITLSTAGISSGQSRYALIQAKFAQTDIIPTDDPNSGVLPYYNADNPANVYMGPGGFGAMQSTRRAGVCTLSVKYGAVASTGSESAPSADSGAIGLYLIDLAYGQTAIAQNKIVTVSGAPFLAGLLGSHHHGVNGQAPKIDLTSEVSGVLALANLPPYPMAMLPVSSALAGSALVARYTYAGNPNGHVAGTAAVPGVSPADECTDVTNNVVYVCTSSGTAAQATWVPYMAVTKGTGDSTANVATTAFVQQEISRNARVYCHPDISFSNADYNSAPHNQAISKILSVVPMLVCQVADQGWQPGDVVVPNSNSHGSENDRGVTVAANGSSVKWAVSTNGIYVTSFMNSPGNAQLTSANWKLRIVITYIPQ